MPPVKKRVNKVRDAPEDEASEVILREDSDVGEIADLDDGAGKDGDQSSQVDDDSDAADHQKRKEKRTASVKKKTGSGPAKPMAKAPSQGLSPGDYDNEKKSKPEKPRHAPELKITALEEDWAVRRTTHAKEILRVRRWLLWSNFGTLVCAATVPALEFAWFYDVESSAMLRYGATVAGSALIIFAIGLIGLLKAAQTSSWLVLHVVLGSILGAATAAFGIHRFELTELKCSMGTMDPDVCKWINGSLGQFVSSFTALLTLAGLVLPVCCSLILLIRKESLYQIKVQTLEVTDAILRLEYDALRQGQRRLMTDIAVRKLVDRCRALDLEHLADVLGETNNLHSKGLLLSGATGEVTKNPSMKAVPRQQSQRRANPAPSQSRSTVQRQIAAQPSAARREPPTAATENNESARAPPAQATAPAPGGNNAGYDQQGGYYGQQGGYNEGYGYGQEGYGYGQEGYGYDQQWQGYDENGNYYGQGYDENGNYYGQGYDANYNGVDQSYDQYY